MNYFDKIILFMHILWRKWKIIFTKVFIIINYLFWFNLSFFWVWNTKKTISDFSLKGRRILACLMTLIYIINQISCICFSLFRVYFSIISPYPHTRSMAGNLFIYIIHSSFKLAVINFAPLQISCSIFVFYLFLSIFIA